MSHFLRGCSYNRKDAYEYERYDLMELYHYVNRTTDGRRALLKALEYNPDDTRLLKNLDYYKE